MILKEKDITQLKEIIQKEAGRLRENCSDYLSQEIADSMEQLVRDIHRNTKGGKEADLRNVNIISSILKLIAVPLTAISRQRPNNYRTMTIIKLKRTAGHLERAALEAEEGELEEELKKERELAARLREELEEITKKF